MEQILMIDLGKQYGGAERYVESICKLLENQYCFHVLVRNNSLFYDKCCAKKIKNIIGISLNPLNLFENILKVKKYILDNNIDIIHAHGINSEVFCTVLRSILRNKKIMFVSTVHGIAEMDRIQDSLLKQKLFAKMQILALKKFDSIIAVSNSIKEDLIKKGLKSSKIHVIYHYVTSCDIERKYEKHTPLKICCVGRLEKVKNTELLIKAISIIKNENNIVCNIYGDGSLKKDLQNQIDELGLNKMIFLKGYNNKIEKVYYENDILVQPSLYESFGLTIIEAMKCGLPVVCSNVGGMAEIIENNVTGLLFENNNVEQLANILQKVCQNKYNLKDFSKREQETVAIKFNEDIHKKYLQNIYDKRAI